MDQVLEILRSLGINSTVLYQFVIFFFAYISMQFIVFNPYLKAYSERVRRTVGGQEEAQDLLDQADQQESRFKDLAKDLNGKIKAIFSEKNALAKTEVEKIVNQAKETAESQLKESRQALNKAVEEARKDMENHIPEISKNIENKFVRH